MDRNHSKYIAQLLLLVYIFHAILGSFDMSVPYVILGVVLAIYSFVE